MCYVTNEGAANLVEAARNSEALTAFSGIVTLLLVIAMLASWGALRAAREMRKLRAEAASFPPYVPAPYGADPYGTSSATGPYHRWEN